MSALWGSFQPFPQPVLGLFQQQLHFSSCSLKIRDAGLAAPPVQVEALGEILSLLDSLVLCHWAGERGNSPTWGALNIYRPLRC